MVRPWAESDPKVPEARARLEDDAGIRGRLFEAVFPRMAAGLELAWQAGKSAPYQRGWSRRAFRAPGSLELTRPARLDVVRSLAFSLQTYDPDVRWLAEWAGHIDRADDSASVLAATIDAGGDDSETVFSTLMATLTGEHPVGRMGRHVPGALLASRREDGWDAIERLLVAAERQEGLRKVILETVDLAHPTAFRRMLGLIGEREMTRFSSVVRAVDVWFGFQYEVQHGAASRRMFDWILERAAVFLDDCSAREDAIRSGDGEDACLGLSALAFKDAPSAVPIAASLLSDADPERRMAGAHLLAELRFDQAFEALVQAFDDEDFNIVNRAYQAFRFSGANPSRASTGLADGSSSC